MKLNWYVFNGKIRKSYLKPLGLVTFETESEAEMHRIRLGYEETIKHEKLK